MSLAPSIAVPRTGFNPLPLYIGLFCLLWSFAFVAGKIGVTDCPPLILLTARFSLAGILILGISALREEKWQITWRDAAVFAILGVANNALYLGLGYTGLKTVSAGLGGLIVSANPVFTAALAALFLGESLTWRKVAGLLLGISGVGFIVWHRMSVGTDSLHGILFTLASLASIVVGTILFKVLAPKGSLWIGNGVQNLAGGLALLPVRAHLLQRQRHRAQRTATGRVRVPGARRIDPGLSALVPSVEGVRRDRGERLSLPDAAARHVVRLDGARRACRDPRSPRHYPGRVRHLSGHASRRRAGSKEAWSNPSGTRSTPSSRSSAP